MTLGTNLRDCAHRLLARGRAICQNGLTSLSVCAKIFRVLLCNSFVQFRRAAAAPVGRSALRASAALLNCTKS